MPTTYLLFLDNSLTSETDFKQKKKVRILSNKSVLSKQFAMKNIRMNVKRDLFKKERAQKRESSVNMYGKYRIGDFPDIQITNASVIKPLVELAKVSFIHFADKVIILIHCYGCQCEVRW